MPKRKHHLTKRKKGSKIDPMSDDETPTTVIAKKSPPKIIIAAILALILILSLALLNYYHIFNIPFFQPKSSPSKQVNPNALDTCDLTKEGNPLVEEISNQAGAVRGSLKGQITEVNQDDIRQSLVLNIQSLDKTQDYKLNILNTPGLIIYAATNKIASASALQKNQAVRLTFSCNPETNLLEFTKISILSNSPSPQATQSGQTKK